MQDPHFKTSQLEILKRQPATGLWVTVDEVCHFSRQHKNEEQGPSALKNDFEFWWQICHRWSDRRSLWVKLVSREFHRNISSLQQLENPSVIAECKCLWSVFLACWDSDGGAVTPPCCEGLKYLNPTQQELDQSWTGSDKPRSQNRRSGLVNGRCPFVYMLVCVILGQQSLNHISARREHLSTISESGMTLFTVCLWFLFGKCEVIFTCTHTYSGGVDSLLQLCLVAYTRLYWDVEMCLLD